MKLLIIFTLYFFPLFVNAEQFVPKIPLKGKSIENFIPKNWKLISKANGDLNKDKKDDFAFVIQLVDKKNIIHNKDGLGRDILDSNPRMLVIVFKDSLSEDYNFIEKTNTFIIRDIEPVADDPFDEIVISNGILEISFHWWQSVGSWFTSQYSYKFKYQNNTFTLIGADCSSFHRASGDSKVYSFNFLTKKYSLTIGNDFDENIKPKTSWHKISIKEPRTFKTFKEPFTWDFGNIQL
jgi:hypothetical protein